VIDPLNRWRPLSEKPDYAGLPSFAGVPYTEDPADLEGVGAAVVGAPFDDLTSDRPGTRNGPRAIRAAGSMGGPGIFAIAVIGYALAAPVRRQQAVLPLEGEALSGAAPAG